MSGEGEALPVFGGGLNNFGERSCQFSEKGFTNAEKLFDWLVGSLGICPSCLNRETDLIERLYVIRLKTRSIYFNIFVKRFVAATGARSSPIP